MTGIANKESPRKRRFDHLIEATTLPHDIEIEQSLIATCMDQASVVDEIMGWLEPDHFFEPIHAELYGIVRDLHRSGQRPDLLTVNRHSEHIDASQLDGGLPGYLARILASCTMPASVGRQYARDIVRLSLRRRGIQDAVDFIEDAYYLPRDRNVTDLVGEMTAKWSEFMAELQDDELHEFDGEDVLDEIVAGLDTEIDEKPRITTGLKDFDDLTGGLRHSEFYVIGGRPSMGKSGVAISLALKMARQGYGQYFVSLEMTAERLMQRCLAELAFSAEQPIEYSRIERRDLHDFEITRLKQARELIKGGLPFVVNQQASPTIIEIEAAARKAKRAFERRGKTLDVVWVDYLGLIKPTNRYQGNKYAETTEISNGLMAMSKRLGVAVVGLSQLSRALEQRDDKRPRMSDLRDSGSIEQDADTIMFCYRDAYYLEREKPAAFKKTEDEVDWESRMSAARNTVELIVAKQRNGPTRTLDLFFHPGANHLGDLQK